METEEEIVVESDAKDGLLGLLTRTQAAITDRGAPIGVLSLDWLPKENEAPTVSAVRVEAQFAESGTPTRMEMHVARALPDGLPEGLLKRALSELGGVDYTSVCIRRDGTELADVTVHFGSRFRFLSSCTLLVEPNLGTEDTTSVTRMLDALGVAHKHTGGTLQVSPRQLRRALNQDAQFAALREADQQGLQVQLYASALPATQFVQVSISPASSDEPSRMECVFARRCDTESGARDAVALRDFTEKHFGFEFGNRSWLVQNVCGEVDEVERRRGPVPDRGRIQYSLNWGLKRR